MTTHQNAAAAAPTITHDLAGRLRESLWDRVAVSFPRRDTRSSFRDLIDGLLMELETRNCWTVAEAVGHASPDRLHYLLERAPCSSCGEPAVATQIVDMPGLGPRWRDSCRTCMAAGSKLERP